MAQQSTMPGSPHAVVDGLDHLRASHRIVGEEDLHAQIADLQRSDLHGHLSVSQRAGLVDLITLRGTFLGRIADFELAATLAAQLLRDAPTDAVALLARARIRVVLHAFRGALGDLYLAQSLAPSATVLDAGETERAMIFQAIGRYDEAMSLRQRAVEQHADLETLGALAALHAELGQTATAQSLFDEARLHSDGVTPFALALLDFHCGQMWRRRGDLTRAGEYFASACDHVPGYAPAHGQLADIEAACGDIESAIERLRPLTESCDDPYYAAQLARILAKAGCVAESAPWRAVAAARYDELLIRHPAAFADRAATFLLIDIPGADPRRALELAQMNLRVRATPRARKLVARAKEAMAATPCKSCRTPHPRGTVGAADCTALRTPHGGDLDTPPMRVEPRPRPRLKPPMMPATIA